MGPQSLGYVAGMAGSVVARVAPGVRESWFASLAIASSQSAVGDGLVAEVLEDDVPSHLEP